MELTTDYINSRYQILNELGRGGMGVVYRVRDRLTDDIIALKQVTVGGDKLLFASSGASTDYRIALTQEFRTLASLRHPHIISVLDYGFDDARRPFFTMELLLQPRTILEAGKDQPFERQMELIFQLLQALLYLHRRGIIHRDLKPENVMVIAGEVRVVDFGLAVARNRVGDGESDETVGTLAYMAPEVLRGYPASEAADLYAVGVMLYQLLTGRHPFESSNISQMITDTLSKPAPVDQVDVSPEIALILERLLHKDPIERYANCRVLIADLEAALGKSASAETESIRESFLQAAHFVGRDYEMGQLSAALDHLVNAEGGGSAWLVGGESGVGKSRLLGELRTYALVRGAQALSGYAIAEKAAPYSLWRPIVRFLCLQTTLSDMVAGILKMIVPDMEALLQRPIPDPPEIEPAAAQERLFKTLELLLSSQPQPILILFEDLHWLPTGDESLAVLMRLSPLVASQRLMIVANYRDDERPTLPDELKQFTLMKLERLSGEAIAQLSASMLGEIVGRREQVVDFIERETEGNVFFIVEVVRVLAEEAGQLDMVGLFTLPQSVFAGGMRTVVQRRLNQLPVAARPLLELAGVAGRQLDLTMLASVAAEWSMSLDDWLAVCADASILDVKDGNWQFVHDKLREGLLYELAPERLREVHRAVALAVERVYLDKPAYVTTLAYHWGSAGDEVREYHYLKQSGEQALQSLSYHLAKTQLTRAVQLADQLDAPSEEKSRLLFLLGRTYYNIGLLEEARIHFQRGMDLNRYYLPKRIWLAGIFPQGVRQIVYRFITRPHLRERTPEHTARFNHLSDVTTALIIISYFQYQRSRSVYYSLLGLNLADSAGTGGRAQQTSQYASAAIFMGVIALRQVARMYKRLSNEMVEGVTDLDRASTALIFQAVYASQVADWEEAERCHLRCHAIAQQLVHVRRQREVEMALTGVRYYMGKWDEALRMAHDLHQAAVNEGNGHTQAWALDNVSRIAMRRGRLDEALVSLHQSDERYAVANDVANGLWVKGALARTYLYLKNEELARQYAEVTLAGLNDSPALSYGMVEPFSALAEYYLYYWELDLASEELREKASRAVWLFKNFAKDFNSGKPQFGGILAWYRWLMGKPQQARRAALRGIEAGERFGMAYDMGFTHYLYGRLLPAGEERQQHLAAAAEIFTRMGCEFDLGRVERAQQVQ